MSSLASLWILDRRSVTKSKHYLFIPYTRITLQFLLCCLIFFLLTERRAHLHISQHSLQCVPGWAVSIYCGWFGRYMAVLKPKLLINCGLNNCVTWLATSHKSKKYSFFRISQFNEIITEALGPRVTVSNKNKCVACIQLAEYYIKICWMFVIVDVLLLLYLQCMFVEIIVHKALGQSWDLWGPQPKFVLSTCVFYLHLLRSGSEQCTLHI